MKSRSGITPDFPIRTASRSASACLICAHCQELSQDTAWSKCSGCRRVAYCGKACQALDWNEHKPFCKRFAKVNAYDAAKGHTLSDLSRRLDYCVEEDESRAMIKVHGSIYRHPIISMGVKCQVCFRTPFHDKEHTFTPCGECKLAWYCSPDCQKLFTKYHSTRQCAELSLVRLTDYVHNAHMFQFQSPCDIILGGTPHPEYISVGSLKGWSEYDTVVQPDFNEHAEFIGKEYTWAHPDAIKSVKLCAVDSSTIVMTVLAGIDQTLPDARTRKKLCIHIIGAEIRETMCAAMMEEILHCMPALRTLTVAYVGPTLRLNSDDDDTANYACESCAPLRRQRFSIRRNVPYHEFVASETYKKNPPDLVAAFNSGMGEVETELWTPTIRHVLEINVPAVLTSYSHWEALNDMLFLRRLNAKLVLPVSRNVWAGVIPNPGEVCEKNNSEHFVNNYWQIVQGFKTENS
uniref:MYND-type domain-containing protein n=1 Tax=Mycena chlorophos TaxID=658473 RepID=A0ABQ0LJL4_MYCCL|nr:predicted protein [Mycena chlorophos]